MHDHQRRHARSTATRRATDRTIASPTCSARMTIDEKLAQLGSAWVFQIADRDRARPPSGPAPLLADGIGHVTRVSGASNLAAADAARAGQRDPALPASSTPASASPRSSTRRSAPGSWPARPPCSRRRSASPARSGPSSTDGMADAVRSRCARSAPTRVCRRCSTCAAIRAGAGCEETYGEDPHLVTQMGIAFIRGLAGRRPRRRAWWPPPSTSSATARRRAASTGRRPTCPSASCATSTSARSRRRCATRRSALGDERLPRARRRAVRRQPLAADRAAPRRVGLRRHGRRPTTSRSASSRTTTTSPTSGPRPRPLALHGRASTSSCPAPTATATPLRDAVERRPGRPIDDRRSRPCARVLDAKFRLGLFERPVRRRRPAPAATRRTPRADRARPPDRQPTASCCCATTACCRSPRRAASIAVIGPNADDRAQPARRLQLRRARRVAARGAEERRATCSAIPIDRGARRRRRDRPRPHRDRARRARSARCPSATVSYAAGCDGQRRRPVGLRRGGRGSPRAATSRSW